jgi:hypothetical protein
VNAVGNSRKGRAKVTPPRWLYYENALSLFSGYRYRRDYELGGVIGGLAEFGRKMPVGSV